MAKVFLNPGHKIGIDPGACNRYMGLQEAEVVMNVGQLVKGYLEAVGYEVELLQSNSLNGEDADWDNPSICDTANASGADVFVSLHCNACNGVAQGTEVEVYSYRSTEANKLGQAIQDQIVGTFDTVNRGLKERPNLSVLRNTDMPAVLVELAFIDNDEDAQLLANDQDRFARAVARGISDYFAM